MWRSVRQTPQVVTRTSTWPGPGSGAGVSVNWRGLRSTGAGALKDMAFIGDARPLVVHLQGEVARVEPVAGVEVLGACGTGDDQIIKGEEDYVVAGLGDGLLN